MRVALLKALFNGNHYCLEMILECATESALEANADLVEQVRENIE